MRDARPLSLLLGALLMLGMCPDASAQLFGRSRKMRKATEMIHRQAPPVVNASMADAVTPENAKVVVSLSKQRAYLMADEEIYIDTPISSGKRAGMTPTGSF
ncbi:MAG TPA: L,D-transpeptidase, partial [Chthoniobacteraceae bacterium]|nr:L,D-transpeptidase [Chthoniobacteraceae bacterium]